MNPQPFAEEVNYWKPGRSDPDSWIEKARKQVERLGGSVLTYAFGHEVSSGRAAFVLAFQIGEDKFKVIWPVLSSKTGDDRAARIQAATMLYHDVKARCLSSAVLGARAAFLSYLLLPDGRTVSQMSLPELAEGLPACLAAGERSALPAAHR